MIKQHLSLTRDKNSMPSDGVEDGSTAGRSSPALSHSSPAQLDNRPPMSNFTFSFNSPIAQAPKDDILPKGTSSDGVQIRASSQQEGEPSNMSGTSSSGSRAAPLFGSSSSFSFFCLSPADLSAPMNSLVDASSTNARHRRGPSIESHVAVNASSFASSNNKGGASAPWAESISSFRDLSPSAQLLNSNAIFSKTSRSANTSRATTPQDTGSLNIFGHSSRQLSPSRIGSPQNNIGATTPSVHASGAVPFWAASVGNRSSKDRVFTPWSDSGSLFGTFQSNLNLNVSPSPASRSPSVDRHQVLPSIEQQDDAPTTPGTARSSVSQTPSTHGRISSVTLSPPKQGHDGRLGGIGSIDRALAQLAFSPPISAPIFGVPATTGSESPNSGTETEAGINTDYNPSKRSRCRHRRNTSAAAEPHNIRDETPPNDRFNAAPLQDALRDAKTFMGELANVLGSGALHREAGSKMSEFYAEAQRLNRFECVSGKMVGVVGASGTGKNSVLNSLLDCENLANTDSGRAACTCVVTEYHYRHGGGCVIRVECYSLDEIRKQVEDLLLPYCHFLRYRNVLDASVDEEKARLATNTFKAIFRRHEIDKAFLLANLEEEVLHIMYQWLEEAELPDEEDIVVSLNEVSVDAHILSKGLILVDLPGLPDVNSARQSTVEKYIRQCDEIFALCPFPPRAEKRAATKTSVDGVVDLLQQINKPNIGIICTHHDSFQPKQERGKVQEGKLRGQIDACDRDHRSQLKPHEFDIQKRLMEVCAQRIGDYSLSQEIAVFIVSNTMYWKHRKEPQDLAVPWLQLSGIPSVRQYCMGIASGSQFAAASRFLRDDVSALLNTIGLWVRHEDGSGSTTTDRTRLEALEREMQRSLLKRTSELNSIPDIYDEFKTNLYVPGCEQVDAWATAAAKECSKWNSWTFRTYHGFCIRFGKWRTPTGQVLHWNERIMKAMNESMGPSWSALAGASKARMERLTRIISPFMNYLKAERHDSCGSFNELIEVLISQERRFIRAIERAWEAFDGGLRLLQTDATKPEPTCFIGKQMEDAYGKASRESGYGALTRCQSLITGAASSPELYHTILDKSHTKFEELISNLEKQVAEAVAHHTAMVMEALNNARGKDMAHEAERDPALMYRVEREVLRMREAMHGLITAAGLES
ncbi:hypothetical protein F5Y14DRAFT_451759 [Nemania sp. NC0429]|nr:hypothetical protein F5Y14DRAFT_451759 [Nemania sp. NC0429]